MDYLVEQFSALGVSPGNPDGTWVQDVPLVGITPQPPQNLVVSNGVEALALEPATDYVAATRHVVDAVAVDGAEFVFVGYGARAARVRLGRFWRYGSQRQDSPVPGQRSAARRYLSADPR